MDKKWNLQDIKPSESRQRSSNRSRRPDIEASSATSVSKPQNRREKVPKNNSGRRLNKPLLLIGLVLILVVAGGFFIGSLFEGAKITVFPRWREPVVNTAFTIQREASADELPYEILTLEAEGERQVSATGQEEVTEQATGIITIKNTTDSEERLIKNTRFETGNGLIFRTTESAVVPASGEVTAEVFADEPGEDYNVGAGTSFTIPGYRENDLTELYSSVTAVAASDFTGGWSGPRFLIEEAELASASASLHQELEEALRSRLQSERPAGFVLFDNAVTFTFLSLPSEEVGEGQVKIKEKAVLRVPIFKEEDIAAYIAKAVVPGYENEPVRLEDASALEFSYADIGTVNSDIAATSSLAITLSGKPRIIWSYDEESLKSDLAGKSQTSINTVLGGYPAIEKASVSIRPFWSTSFPNDTKKITVEESFETNQ